MVIRPFQKARLFAREKRISVSRFWHMKCTSTQLHVFLKDLEVAPLSGISPVTLLLFSCHPPAMNGGCPLVEKLDDVLLRGCGRINWWWSCHLQRATLKSGHWFCHLPIVWSSRSILSPPHVTLVARLTNHSDFDKITGATAKFIALTAGMTRK